LLLLPDDGATGVAAYTTFSWQSTEDVVAYHFQLSGNDAFAASVIDDSTLTETTYTAQSPLAYSTTYYWRVRADALGGAIASKTAAFGPWSEVRWFIVAVGTAAENESTLPTEFALHANYPNPFNPSTTIQYDLPEAATVRITVFDALGRLVESMVIGHRSAGRYKVTWDADRVPSGVYIVRLVAGAFAQTRRILLLR
jgi:hypothetical protein